MTAEKMRQELVNYFENAGQPQLAEKAKIMPVEEVYENYKKIIEEDAYDQARNKLEEETDQKEFEQWKARGKKI